MKRDRAQTKIRIDKIPAELCTRKQAAEILGLHGSAIGRNQRFKSLQFAYAVYKGKRIVLYNRKAVEALKYAPCPDGYVNVKDAASILGFKLEPCGGSEHTIRTLRKHGVQCKLIKAHHSYLVWKREDVEKVKKLLMERKR